MAIVTRSATASVDASTAMFAKQLTGLIAGEDLGALDACQIKADGKAWKANGSAADTNAAVRGFAPRAAKAGSAITLFGDGARARYSDGTMTPGQSLFLGGTAGLLADAATTGGSAPVAYAISATDIMIHSV